MKNRVVHGKKEKGDKVTIQFNMFTIVKLVDQRNDGEC